MGAWVGRGRKRRIGSWELGVTRARRRKRRRIRRAWELGVAGGEEEEEGASSLRWQGAKEEEGDKEREIV